MRETLRFMAWDNSGLYLNFLESYNIITCYYNYWGKYNKVRAALFSGVEVRETTNDNRKDCNTCIHHVTIPHAASAPE